MVYRLFNSSTVMVGIRGSQDKYSGPARRAGQGRVPTANLTQHTKATVHE